MIDKVEKIKFSAFPKEKHRIHHPSLDSLIQNIKCSQCGSSETYTITKSSGISYRLWYKTTDGQIVCNRCSGKNYYSKHRSEVLDRTKGYRDSHRILLQQRNARLRQKIFRFPGGPRK